jgi:NADH-quinone oxidoreductase subunit F
VLDDSADLVRALANIAEFYAHESCGQCTPCREGALWISKVLRRMTHGGGRKQDADYLLHIARNLQGRTVCAFGEACAWPVLSFVTKFKEEFETRGAADEAKDHRPAGRAAEPRSAASPHR